MEKLKIPHFESVQEELKFIQANKKQIVAQKKAAIKYADGFAFVGLPNLHSYGVSKDASTSSNDVSEIRVKAIINTTNILDSHDDVHIPGIWDKSLKENKMIMHIQEHDIRKFSSVISDGKDLEASTKDFTFKELGFNFKGKTEALLFDSLVKRSRNKFMFNQYNEGFVKNHSVGMRYIKLFLAIANKEIASAEEFETWEKYISEIANKKDAEKKQYFWAVTEAKVIEGSAVPLGSNFVTPTISVEAEKSLQTEAEKSLQETKNYFINL